MTAPHRQPAIFLSHGGGPCFWMEWPEPIGRHGWDGLRDYLSGLVATLPERPRAFLVISAHWEEEVPTIGASATPEMIYDYYGFPPHTYELQYPAPAALDIARQARELLEGAGIETATDTERGYDHGVFVPFLIVNPEADIPVALLSLRHDLDPAAHIAIGRALAPLRDQGVAIIGSGMSYHNLREFRDGDGAASARFDQWLTDTVTADPQARDAGLIDWQGAPAARAVHPREEHLLPLMVVAGAAGSDRGRRDFHDIIGGKTISGYRFD